MFCLICGQLKHADDFIIYEGGEMCIQCYRGLKNMESEYKFEKKYVELMKKGERRKYE